MASLTWTCETTGRDARPRWTAEVGPARLVARLFKGRDGAPDIWCVHLEADGERVEMPGDVRLTIGEAIESAEPWARETLERWRDLGELARVALRAWDGET